MPAIPLKAEDITAEWMQSVLPDVCVESVEVSPGAAKGDNFAGQVVRAAVTGRKNQLPYHESFILKIMPVQDWHRKLVIDIEGFKTEICVYEQVFPDFLNKQNSKEKLVLSVPRCIYSDKQDENGVIVLEDLKSQGYVLTDLAKGQDYNQCILVMEELAKFHALGYNIKYSSKIPPKDLYPDLGQSLFVALMDGLFLPAYELSYNRAVDVLKLRSGHEPLVNYLNNVKDALKESVTDVYDPIEPYSTFCHGDCWNSNMMFKYDDKTGKPVSLKLLDFQGVVYCCPTEDLAHFFFTSVKGPLRKKHLKDFLRHYHDKLFKYLNMLGVTQINKDNFSFDKLYELYYKTACVGLSEALWCVPIIFTPKDNLADIQEIDADNMADAFKSWEINVGESLKHNPDVQEHIWSIVEEMYEHVA